MAFVIDCSITMAWLFEDERTEFSEKVLDRLDNQKAMVPSIWILEVLNVLLVGEKRKRITQSQSLHFLNVLNSLPIEIIDNKSIIQKESILSLARAYNLTAYDASYLELASQMGISIATLDFQLISAAKDFGVEILES